MQVKRCFWLEWNHRAMEKVSDSVTINEWVLQWLSNIKANG